MAPRWSTCSNGCSIARHPGSSHPSKCSRHYELHPFDMVKDYPFPDSLKDIGKNLFAVLRLVDVREDYRRLLLLVPFVPLVLAFLLYMTVYWALKTYAKIIFKPLYDSVSPDEFIGNIFRLERHSILRRLVEQHSPLLLPMLVPFLLDCLLYIILITPMVIVSIVLVSLMLPLLLILPLIPRSKGDEIQLWCCNCLTQYHCETRFNTPFSFAQQACTQCRSRAQQWIWVRCISAEGSSTEWMRVTPDSGQLVPATQLTGASSSRPHSARRPPADPISLSITHVEAGPPALTPTRLASMPDITGLELPKHLTALPAFVLQMTSLTSLSLTHCRCLKALPLDDLLKLSSLTDLNCESCTQLWSIPEEVCRQGGQATMQFLHQVQVQQGQRSREMTLFLIGDGEAGKTSVIMALRSDQHRATHIRADHRTVGIDILQWRPADAEGMTVRVFDLAGQAVYAKTHQFFLLRRGLYMFVWRPGTAEGRELRAGIQHWLESIQVKVPGAYVMLVVTHIDLVDAATLVAQCLQVKEAVGACLAAMRETVKEGVGVLSVWGDGDSQRVNCLSGKGIVELRRRLIEFATSMPWYGQLLPPSWIALQGELQAAQRRDDGIPVPWLTWDQYRDMAVKPPCSIPRDMLVSVTRFLHDSGAIRFFGDLRKIGKARSDDSPDEVGEEIEEARSDDLLQNTVYISPTWIMNILKGLMRHDRQALIDFFLRQGNRRMLRLTNRLSLCGLLHKDLIPFLWPATSESSAFWSFVGDKGAREGDLWAGNFISDGHEADLAMALLRQFDLIADEGQQLMAPGVLPPRQMRATPALDVRECPWRVSLTYNGLPPGFFHALVVRIAKKQGMSAEVGTDFAVLLDNSQNMVQLFCFKTARVSAGCCSAATHIAKSCMACKVASNNPWQSVEVLLFRSTWENLIQKVNEEVSSMEQSFAGLVRLLRDEREPSERELKSENRRPVESRWAQPAQAAGILCAQYDSIGKACSHVFDRSECVKQWRNSTLQASTLTSGMIACPKCKHSTAVWELLTTARIPEMRNCPCCTAFSRRGEVGTFNAGECRLKLDDDDDDKRDRQTVTCITCLAQGRPGQVRIIDVTGADVFVSGLQGLHPAMQQSAFNLMRDVEREADVVCSNRSLQPGPLRPLEQTKLVVVLLSDAYVLSPDCRAELAAAVRSCMPLVPILMPPTSLRGASHGWSGPRASSQQYWLHAAQLCQAAGVSAQEGVDWSFLQHFAALEYAGGKTDEMRPDLAADVARCVGARLHRLGRVDVYSDFSMLGVKLSFFDKFIQSFGGAETFRGLTTQQVMARYVLPATRESRLSYCELMRADSEWRELVDTADWFYSHTWKYLFLDVVDAAKRHFEGPLSKEPVLWFDVFSVSQHKTEVRPFEWWSSVFLNSVGSIGRVLMLMQPFDDAASGTPAWVTLSRVWCVFEMYACEATLSHFEVTMTRDMSARFLDALAAGDASVLAKLVEVECEKSTASSPGDKARVFQVIERTVGFGLLNSTVMRVMEKWLISRLASSPTTPDASGRLLATVVEVVERCQARRARMPGLGSEHPDSLHSMFSLAGLYHQQRRLDRAETLHRECLEGRRRALGAGHADTQASLRALASLYRELGRAADAEALFLEPSESSHPAPSPPQLVPNPPRLGQIPSGAAASDRVSGDIVLCA